MLHDMHCVDPWFSYIKSGVKTIEGRKNSPKWSLIKVSDKIKFINCDDSFIAEVVKIDKYNTLDEYLAEHLNIALPGIKTIEEGKDIYLKWSTPAEIKQYGFLAIHVRVI